MTSFGDIAALDLENLHELKANRHAALEQLKANSENQINRNSDVNSSSLYNTSMILSSCSPTVLCFEDLNLEQPMAFKRLFFTPPEQNMKHQARTYLFKFFSDKDRKSFGCVNKSCHAIQKEMDITYEKSFR